MAHLTLFNIVVAVALCAGAGYAQECPELYLRFSKGHTYCKPKNQQCTILDSGLAQGAIETILEEHNKHRSNIATGKVGKFPSAGNMMQMVWDNELAAVAQAHANQCSFEHDCGDCRRVQNFGVGQNLMSADIPKGSSLPKANWKSSVQGWYDEIKDMNMNSIDKFIPPPPKPTYGHFTQVIWAESWRVGCGYVLYDAGSIYKQLYTCNYGPAGNMKNAPLYKRGASCSECPENSCCGNNCGDSPNYAGLCKINDDRGPIYKPQGSNVFYCDWQDQDDCGISVAGVNKWLIYSSLSGKYLSIVLKGGEESTLTFAKLVKPTSSASSACLVTTYRLGPNVDGQEESHTAKEVYTIVSQNYEVKQDLRSMSGMGISRQQWTPFSMGLGWDMETQLKIVFSVPAGKPDQFLEIKNVYAYDGPCNR